MSTDKQGRRSCDGFGCGRRIEKAQRVHKGQDYCGTCYKRHFVRAQCPTCSGSVVYHKSELQIPSCGECDRSERSCSRCGRPAPDARLVTVASPGPCEDVMVTETVVTCLSCYPYFIPAVPCDICKEPSQRLSGASHLPEGTKACPKCRTSDTHATCSGCRKSRKVAHTTPKGKPLCADCVEDRVHLCPDCQCPVKGAGAARCEGCSIKARLRKKVSLNTGMLERPWLAELYRGYGEWLLSKSIPTAALPEKAAAAASFFRKIDLDDDVRQPLIASDLLRIFDSGELRKHLNAQRFVCEHYGIEIDQSARSQARDLARIERGLKEAAGKPWESLLRQYRQALAGKPARTTAQYLAVAQAFCVDGQISGPFGQAEIVAYLSKVPGARATLSTWVSFVRTHYGWQVSMPPKHPAKVSIKRDALKLNDLLQHVASPQLASDEDLVAVLHLVYQFDSTHLKRHITSVDLEGNIQTKNGAIAVQKEMKGLVLEWAKRNL